MTESITVPFNYPVCLQSNCSKMHSCLRSIALKHISPTQKHFTIINPKLVDNTQNKCQYYRSAMKVRYGKGFKQFFDELPRKQSELFASAVIKQFNRSDYFYYRKGEKMLSPARQQILQDLLTKCGITKPLILDTYIEEYDW